MANLDSSLAIVGGDRVPTKGPNMSSCSREHWRDGLEELAEGEDTTGDKTDAGFAASE